MVGSCLTTARVWWIMGRIVLPIFPLNGIVLLPGETLPLRLFSDAYVGLIHRLLCKGSAAEGEVQGTLGVVNIPKNPRRSTRSSAGYAALLCLRLPARAPLVVSQA